MGDSDDLGFDQTMRRRHRYSCEYVLLHNNVIKFLKYAFYIVLFYTEKIDDDNDV